MEEWWFNDKGIEYLGNPLLSIGWSDNLISTSQRKWAEGGIEPPTPSSQGWSSTNWIILLTDSTSSFYVMKYNDICYFKQDGLHHCAFCFTFVYILICILLIIGYNWLEITCFLEQFSGKNLIQRLTGIKCPKAWLKAIFYLHHLHHLIWN